MYQYDSQFTITNSQFQGIDNKDISVYYLFMPRSSKASLTDETIQELENQFYDFISSLTPDERRKFFSEFLTNEEKMMMYKRLALYWCLLEGYTLSKIQQLIGVTHDTTRVYNKKKNMLSDEFKSLLKRIGGENMPSSEDQEPKSQEMSNEPEENFTQESAGEPAEEASSQMENMEENHGEMRDENMGEEQKMEETQQMENAEEMHEEPVVEVANEHIEISNVEAPEEQKMEFEGQHHEENEMGSPNEENQPSGLAPSENSEKEDNKDNEDEEGGKKKSGLAKFFGF